MFGMLTVFYMCDVACVENILKRDQNFLENKIDF